MAQAKKKQSTKTAKKSGSKRTGSRANTRTNRYKRVSSKERMHIYMVTALSMVAAILLCADIAMVNV